MTSRPPTRQHDASSTRHHDDLTPRPLRDGTTIATSQAPDGDGRDDHVAAVLSVPTRAGIYRRLRTDGQPLSARDAAEAFGIHANVARSHLDALAEAGLVVTAERRHPGGGRPARVYVAREQATGGVAEVPTGSQLAVATVVQLIAGLVEHEGRLELLAEDQARRLVAGIGGRADRRPFEAAVLVAVEALRTAFPEVRVDELHGDHVHVAGLEVGLRIVGEVDARVGDALARGFLRGAVAAAGALTTVTSVRGLVRAAPDPGGPLPAPERSLDLRGATYEAGVTAARQALEPLRPGAYLEVMTDVEGAPAAFARWGDRAGHQIVDVTRRLEMDGRSAVRILLRKAAG